MIFGIKTRKDLKKEIEKLNKQLEEYRGSESIRKVNIVRTTRPLARLQACCGRLTKKCTDHRHSDWDRNRSERRWNGEQAGRSEDLKGAKNEQAGAIQILHKGG